MTCSKCGGERKNDTYGSVCEDCFALAADRSKSPGLRNINSKRFTNQGTHEIKKDKPEK